MSILDEFLKNENLYDKESIDHRDLHYIAFKACKNNLEVYGFCEFIPLENSFTTSISYPGEVQFYDPIYRQTRNFYINYPPKHIK